YGPGAFTGAAAGGRTGKLGAADGGTLFLDEVGELSPSAQAMLLRFLEDGTFYRVGEASERRADVRLIAATSRDLPALATNDQFRSDLYFRMRGVVLRLPPLRNRNHRRQPARPGRARGAPARAEPGARPPQRRRAAGGGGAQHALPHARSPRPAGGRAPRGVAFKRRGSSACPRAQAPF